MIFVLVFISVFILALILIVRRKESFTYEKSRICICMSHTSNIYEYSKLAAKINSSYAKRHGYDFELFETELTDRAPQWCKVKVINELLNKKYDYVFWIDADAIFNDFDRKLESIIALDPSKEIYICDDIPNSGRQKTVNTGTILVKNTDWTRKFCKEWWNYKGNFLFDHYHEQTVLESYIYQKNYIHKFHIATTNEFNSINGNNKPTDYILHLMALPKEYRVAVFTSFIESKL